jgi:hypothetical protein
MVRAFIICTILLMGEHMNAQKIPPGLPGQYYMQGVMETASGFKLNADSTFEFFYVYGALDRFGEGKWTVKDSMVVLNSRPKPATDFTLISRKNIPGKEVTIKVTDKNPLLLSYVRCSAKNKQQHMEQVTDNEGFASFALPHVDSIRLVCAFSEERSSVFDVSTEPCNYFEFRFEPWIAEVFFDNFSLQLVPECLQGTHPLLTRTQLLYRKE